MKSFATSSVATLILKIVSDSSALIALFDCNEIAILELAFSEVIIPQEVEIEVFKRRSFSRRKPRFIKIHSITTDETLATFNRLRGRLDPGEAAAISLARQLELEVIMDEEVGQSVCVTEGVGYKSLADEQYAGRLHRDHAGKRDVIVYDYIDADVPVLARMASKRRIGYRALGYRLRPAVERLRADQASATESREPNSSDDRRPSEVFETYWIHAERKVGSSYPDHGDRGGKWLLFIKTSEIDRWWSIIKAATESGLLGGSAKVATMKPNPNAASPDKRVICVYTYDVADEADCTRVRKALRDLGVTWKIPYKTDADTYAGKYADGRDSRVSTRYE